MDKTDSPPQKGWLALPPTMPEPDSVFRHDPICGEFLDNLSTKSVNSYFFFGDVHILVYTKGKPPYMGVCLFKLLDIYLGN